MGHGENPMRQAALTLVGFALLCGALYLLSGCGGGDDDEGMPLCTFSTPMSVACRCLEQPPRAQRCSANDHLFPPPPIDPGGTT
jgi:hypothetical protein